MNIVFLLLGLGLILSGANLLTDGASALARRWGVSDLVIGLTVVAFGTSAPELVISIMSAINGSAELAIGNVVGSNIFNVLAIIGITSLVRPIIVRHSIMTADIPLVIVSALVCWLWEAARFLATALKGNCRASTALCCLCFSQYLCAIHSRRQKAEHQKPALEYQINRECRWQSPCCG